jgi:hypothetical protein
MHTFLYTITTKLADAGATVSPSTCNTDCSTGLPKVQASSGNVHTILSITFGILAVVAVLFVVIAALKFVTASGDPQEVAKARNTIIYALVGLVIAISAEVFVAFVLNKI